MRISLDSEAIVFWELIFLSYFIYVYLYSGIVAPLIKRSGYSQSCSANSLQVPHFLIRRAALRIRKYATWRLFAEQRLANHSTALFCAWAEALLGVECVVVFFAAGQIGVVGCVFWDTSYYYVLDDPCSFSKWINPFLKSGQRLTVGNPSRML